MTILLYFDFLGILFSLFVHLCLLLGFSIPSNELAVVLNIGIGAVFGARLVLTKELRKGKIWFFDKSLKNIGPYWLKFTMGLIVIYGIVTCVVSLVGSLRHVSVGMTQEDFVIASNKLFIGLFSLIMACYAVEYLLLYLYKILKKAEMKKFKIESAFGKEIHTHL